MKMKRIIYLFIYLFLVSGFQIKAYAEPTIILSANISYSDRSKADEAAFSGVAARQGDSISFFQPTLVGNGQSVELGGDFQWTSNGFLSNGGGICLTPGNSTATVQANY